MERTDWLHAGIDPSQAGFLVLTAITHHNSGSPAWGETQVRRRYAELAWIDAAAAKAGLAGRSPQSIELISGRRVSCPAVRTRGQ
jgi:hypothetical protein